MAKEEKSSGSPGSAVGPRELVVIAKPEAKLRATTEGVRSLSGEDVSSLRSILRTEDAVLEPFFGAFVIRLSGYSLPHPPPAPAQSGMKAEPKGVTDRP